jgi:hypothetical protein
MGHGLFYFEIYNLEVQNAECKRMLNAILLKYRQRPIPVTRRAAGIGPTPLILVFCAGIDQ